MKSFKTNFFTSPINSFKRSLYFNQKFFLGTNASYVSDSTKVKLRGKFLKSKREDMPTLLWFPEVLEHANSSEKFFTNPLNKV